MKKLSMMLALLLSFSLTGCGGGGSGGADRPETAPTTVTVTYKGSPVEGATVTLAPKSNPGGASGTAAVGLTDSSGVATLNSFNDKEGVVPGDYDVLVTKMEKPAASSAVSMDDPNYDGAPEASEAPAPPKSLIPEKYKDAKTSGIEAKVEAGKDNEIKAELAD